MRTETFLLPSGMEAKIRESTGADDDVLSSLDDPNQVINRYLANLTLKLGDKENVTTKDIKELRLRDKYFILVKARIFSLGNILYFKHEWGAGAPSPEYSIDLNDFVWDFKEELPGIGDHNYSDQRILPYSGVDLERALSTGKEVKMDYLDGHGEEFLLKKPFNSRTINLQLLARNLQIKDGAWMKVKNFSVFTSREMAEIRAIYEEFDPPVEGLVEITHPITNIIHRINLLEIKDFFFPVKVS